MSCVSSDSWELINVISELRSVVMSPMPLYLAPSSPPPPPPPPVSNNGTSSQLPQASNHLDRRNNEKGEIRDFVLILYLLSMVCVFIELESFSNNETNLDQDKSTYNSRTESPSHSGDGSVISERTLALLQSKVSNVHKEDLATMITIVTSKG